MALKDKFAVWEKDLIDMSRRNTLLYYRESGMRPSGLSLPAADSQLLFEKIALAGKTVNQTALQLPDPQNDPVPLRRLERIRVQARDDLKESGAQTLFMVFGMLHWMESEESSEEILSPLILVPVKIDRRAGNEYNIACVDEDAITVNPSLREKLNDDFQLTLPEWDDLKSQSQLSPELTSDTSASKGLTAQVSHLWNALAKIGIALNLNSDNALTQRWRITDGTYLGRFSFTKLVMREDLLHNQDTALEHPVLRKIAGEPSTSDNLSSLVRAESLDEKVRPLSTFEILDADSSQEEAIQAAIAGQSYVLQGPPGTGKSQTIANIIAESLARGKSVLFVSEKMAALDVVRKRLTENGLDEFLLDLHDAKRTRKDFAMGLKDALKQAQAEPDGRNTSDWERQSLDLERRRTQLNEYVAELHKTRFTLDISAFRAHGELALLADAPKTAAPLANVTQFSARDIAERRDALSALLGFQDVLDTYTEHPWRDTPLKSLTGAEQDALGAHFLQLSTALGQANGALLQLRSRLGETAPITLAWAEFAQERTKLALTSPLPPRHWLDVSQSERLSKMIAYGATQAAGYANAHQQLDTRYQDRVYLLDHNALLTAINNTVQPALPMLQTPAGSDPRNVALRERSALDTRLTAIVSLVPAFAQSAATAASALGRVAPTTLAEITAVTEQANVVASSPTPPKTWLDADLYAEARIAAMEAVERAEWAQQARAHLEQRYTPQFFTTDLSAISARFRERHTSLLRYVNPQFYLDNHALRQLVQPGVVINQSELASDALLIARLHEYEQWRQDNRSLHARILGRYEKGAQTDWAAVRAMIDWTDRLHAAFGERALPAPVTQLVMGSANDRLALSAVAQTLSEQAAQWRDHRAWLDQMLVMSQLAETYFDIDRLPVATLTTKLTDLHTQLAAFWVAVDTLTATMRTPAIIACAQMAGDLEAARVAHTYTTWVAQRTDDLRENLGSQFAGVQTDWSSASKNHDWVKAFLALYPDGVPDALAEWISTPSARQETTTEPQEIQLTTQRALATANAAIATIQAEAAEVARAIPLDSLAGNQQAFDKTTLVRLRERANETHDNLPLLKRWVDCEQAMQNCRALGLAPLLSAFRGAQPFPRNIVQVFERQFYTHWLDAARQEAPMLATISGDIQTKTTQAFRDLDRNHIVLARSRLAQMLRQRRNAAYLRADAIRTTNSRNPLVSAYSDLAREVQKTRHQSIRQIVRKVGPALLELQPCWMMSPLSVSQFIESADPIFDVVIFDEASQVFPEDAICAIMRGKQLIVVGDDKQLPPTSFFAKARADDGDDDDDDEEPSAESERTESILNELNAAGFKSRKLLWHYRSHHESLIAFSNSEFYDNELITFPGPATNHSDGVKFSYVSDGVYGAGVNRREADRVVDELLNIVHSDQRSSIGVIAMSVKQRDAIRDALENRFKRQPDLAFLRERLSEESDAEDAFFIKNLENVQGDERDIILLCIGYGKDSKGKMALRFGPINREGGARRLNVAVTRARYRMIVVSSIKASDIPPTRSAGAGVLRRYLDFAERGPKALQNAPTSAQSGKTSGFESPFEVAVYEALTKQGLNVDTQVGCSGYRIDLAIRDDQESSRYLLGVECDGASYHSSKTARDRDRLRQAHLEGLGWRIHRIWSSDWIANPTLELNKTLEALRQARMKTPPPSQNDQQAV